MLLQLEVNVRTHGNVEWAQFVGFVSRRHNDVPVGVPVQLELLVVKAPRNELQRIFIQYVVFRWLNVSRVDVETNHGPNKSLTNLFLPSLLRPAESDFDCRSFSGLKLEKELGVLHPSARVCLVLKLLVIEMATTGASFLPLG